MKPSLLPTRLPKFSLLLLLIFGCFNGFSQTPATSPEAQLQALQDRASSAQNSLLTNLKLENIGPSIMSGRVVQLAVNPDNPIEFYVAYASGGLWHTANNGTSFTPVMDTSPTQNLGAIAVDWNSGTIWAGTGENNSSRSSYAGIGMYKSTDKGATWEYMGLPDSHHIGRISIHPERPDEVLVGVLGHLYSPNAERGVYRTTDGGQTWEKTLFINEDTGIIDLVVAPESPDIVYAASWQRDRKAWNFEGSGEGSGIYKSQDGGKTWNLVSESGSGFPTGNGVGRIGLAIYDRNTVYAVHDNQFRRDKATEEQSTRLQKEDFKNMSADTFLKLDNGDLNAFLEANRFPREYRAKSVKAMVREREAKPADLAIYLEDANSLLFDTPVVGAEVYKTIDGGKTWNKTHDDFIEDLYYSYGYYFGQIRVAAYDPDQIYIAGVPQLRSTDGGKTFESIGGPSVHADHHALWINPNQPGHLINGNDGGVNITYDYGESWIKNNSPTVGQFYAITVDNAKPYNVYGGLQDNGVWKGAHTSRESDRWHAEGEYPWKRIMGGDGMQVQVDPRNNDIVYTGFQFGNYFRLNLGTGDRKRIQPSHKLGESPLRFNWQTPILLSAHNPDILYLASNRLHRSMNQGDDFTAISGDLTRGGRKGNVPYGTLATISESPFAFGLLYTGSDDGYVHVSKDGGGSWTRISDSFPGELWVSRVAASKHKKERVYVSLNGYRADDFTPYVYVSEDYGKTWKSIAAGIPDSPVNVILEDPKNENLLYVGTDNGLYASLDRGASWELMENGMPVVAVHDLVVQEEAGHLLVGTHGRSIYKADVAPLQSMTPTDMESDLVLFEMPEMRHSSRWGNRFYTYAEPNTPGLDISFFAGKAGKVKAQVKSPDGVVVSEVETEAVEGLNILSYDLAFSKEGKANYLSKNKTELKEADNGKTYLPEGTYTVILEMGRAEQQGEFTLK
ncbi:Sortilin, neurotensin receptor 3 [Robiginitalea myxolifaciens]|uniref:Sortilin, neurotensin receptor 3 n=1 Tax=Robiginitalea myxolifaciens TaxID=400055 RepID=A0A1I6G156_9FLAO|nr:sialidase family protein [Robiginitalea myxolifaciens]SFR35924.1 Sortilin, neurotensin receptor 3 [Robiginitalea myxolifaciens]